VLQGEIVYPVAPILDLAISVTTTVLRGDDGEILYTMTNSGDLRPQYGPVVNIETRLGSH